MKLVATKSFSYSTRRLKPGDIFEAKDPDARLLIGVRKARSFGDRKEDAVPAPKKETLNKLFSNTSVNKIDIAAENKAADEPPAKKLDEVLETESIETPVKNRTRRGRTRKN